MKKLPEIYRTRMFIVFIIAGWLFTIVDIHISLFILGNLILWAVIEQSLIIANSIRELIKILKSKESKEIKEL